MICPNCKNDNPADARFCQECGTRLATACFKCGYENQPFAKFCSNCGTPLQRPPASVNRPIEGYSTLDRFLPPELAAKLQSARASGAMVGERRVVTILFCDVTGSTAAARQLDPEDWTEVMNGAFEYMIRPVYRYEGTVARLMGDAVLAFFGAPIAHEDDPQRAVLTGLAIQEGFADFRRQVGQRWGIDIEVRVGINTGLVVVGAVGSDLRMEYTAMGEAINLASRLEQTADPGSVQVGEETYRLIAPLFEFEDLGTIEVKGHDRPLQVYRPLRPLAQPGSLRGLESYGLYSDLVGREQELKLLRTRLVRLFEGRGSFILLVGEAGLGKSRLIRELQKYSRSVAWLEGLSISYGSKTSYYPWRELVRQAIGAADTDPPAAVREKLQTTCECCALPGGDLPFLEALLAVESTASLEELQGYEGEALVVRISEAMRGFICGLAQEGPLAIVLDDLHWADEASLDLLLKTADITGHFPLLFLAALRPDRQAASWQFRQRLLESPELKAEEIQLQPLSPGESNRLMSSLLAIDQLPQQVGGGVLAWAEGNPYYVEEVIRMLIDRGQIANREGGWVLDGRLEDVEIPRTLQGVLSARLDRLTEEEKLVLQVASVIGRKFNTAILAEIMGTA